MKMLREGLPSSVAGSSAVELWAQPEDLPETLKPASLGAEKRACMLWRPFASSLPIPSDPRLLQGRAAAYASDTSRAGEVVLNDAGLAGAKLTLTGGANR
jgi:hypothetical protein